MQTLRMVDNTKERLTAISQSLGIGSLGRHIFLCADQSTPRCCSVEEGRAVWRYLKGRLKELDLIDNILPEPLGGAHRDFNAMAQTLQQSLRASLDKYSAIPMEQLLADRYQRLMQFGVFKG